MPREGTVAVTTPPDSAAVSAATDLVLSVTKASAAAGVNPLKEILTLCCEPPELTNTTTAEPSVFLNAVMPVLETVPVVLTR